MGTARTQSEPAWGGIRSPGSAASALWKRVERWARVQISCRVAQIWAPTHRNAGVGAGAQRDLEKSSRIVHEREEGREGYRRWAGEGRTVWERGRVAPCPCWATPRRIVVEPKSRQFQPLPPLVATPGDAARHDLPPPLEVGDARVRCRCNWRWNNSEGRGGGSFTGCVRGGKAEMRLNFYRAWTKQTTIDGSNRFFDRPKFSGRKGCLPGPDWPNRTRPKGVSNTIPRQCRKLWFWKGSFTLVLLLIW
jgi:hypothetical protein